MRASHLIVAALVLLGGCGAEVGTTRVGQVTTSQPVEVVGTKFEQITEALVRADMRAERIELMLKTSLKVSAEVQADMTAIKVQRTSNYFAGDPWLLRELVAVGGISLLAMVWLLNRRARRHRQFEQR